MRGAREAAAVAAGYVACCALPVLATAGIATAPVGVGVAGVAAAGAGIVAVRERRRRTSEPC